MKTATTARLARFRMLHHVVAALAVAALTPWQASAVNPSTDAVDPDSSARAPGGAAAITADPHLAYLEALDVRSPLVRQRGMAVRALLGQREVVARQFLSTPADARAELARKMQRIDEQLDAAETALEEALAATTPEDGPYFVPPEPIDFDGLRASAERRRRPVYLPVPQPAALPPLPAPAREALYIDYLAASAGDSKFAQELVANVAHLLQERRELTYRHACASAHDRARIEGTIRAVSLHVRNSARAVADGATVGDW